MKIDKQTLIAGTGCTSQVADAWLSSLQAAADKYKISDKAEGFAAFLANVGVESGGLSQLVENMNYSAQRLSEVWPQRFAVDSHVLKKTPNAQAILIGGKPELIANTVYANRLGNGASDTGDGYKYRGHGPIQLTGKSNYNEFFDDAGLPEDTDPATLAEPENGSLSAARFFSKSGALDAANGGDFNTCVKKVNGNPPCDSNQGPLRQKRYQAALDLLKAQAPTPAKDQKDSPAKSQSKTDDAAQASQATPTQAKNKQ